MQLPRIQRLCLVNSRLGTAPRKLSGARLKAFKKSHGARFTDKRLGGNCAIDGWEHKTLERRFDALRGGLAGPFAVGGGRD